MKRSDYIAGPARVLLERFGAEVWAAFGDYPYLVGSALERPDFRDVDVRLILDDEQFDRLIAGLSDRKTTLAIGGKWCSLCLAFSALGREMTGLPIDFQIQRMTQSNQEFGGKRRNAIGLLAPHAQEARP